MSQPTEVPSRSAPMVHSPDEDGAEAHDYTRCSIGLAVHRGWAKLLLGRFRDLVQDPRRPRTHTRKTDEDDAEANESIRHTRQVRGLVG